MKKIFLIFVSAVALSSVAASALFAEEKYRHTEQIGAETVTTDVVVTEVSPLEIKFKVRKELVSSKVTILKQPQSMKTICLFITVSIILAMMYTVMLDFVQMVRRCCFYLHFIHRR